MNGRPHPQGERARAWGGRPLARPSACGNRESVLRTLRTRFGPERGSSAPAARVGRERPEVAAFAGGLGTAANIGWNASRCFAPLATLAVKGVDRERRGHPFAELSLGSRGVVHPETLCAMLPFASERDSSWACAVKFRSCPGHPR